jgi:molecular chaperone HscA
MLRDSIDNAREDMERRLLTEAKVDARRGIGAVRSALAADGDLLDGPERAAVEASIAAVEATLSGSDRDAVNQAAEALELATRPFAERRMDRGIRAALAGQRVDQLDV